MKKYSKKEIVIICSFVFLVLISIIGITFAWFSAQVEGNDTASTMVVEIANLKLEFTDTNVIEGDKILPGWTMTKTFTVENLGDVAVNYDIDIIDVASTFEGQDLVYEITSTNGGGTKTETVLPNTNDTLIINATIEPLTTQTYTIKITFKETGEDQNIDQGKTYRGKLQITPRISSVAIAGYALDGEGNPLPNRVVELHSDPVSTTTDSSGYYEFRNVEVGTHTIILKNSSNTAEEARTDVTLAYGSDVKKYNNTVVLDKILRKYINIELNGNTIDLVVEEAELLLGESTGSVMPGVNKAVAISGKGYGELSCTSSDETKATCSITNNILTIVPVSLGTSTITVTESNFNKTVTYELTVEYPTISNKIIADNDGGISDGSVSFNTIPTAANKGLYYTDDETVSDYGEDGERIYYYRGNVDNNWVTLGGYKWRIVRTTSEGGVKLAYSGNGSGTSSGFINTSTKYNSSYALKYYVGYTYNTSSYEGTQTNSTIKGVIDTWYNTWTKTQTAVPNYLSETAVFCNDRSSETLDERSIINYPASFRIVTYNRPTFACPYTNQSRYTVSTTTGNGYLTKPIAMLTVDEVYYAGLLYTNTSASNTYITANATGIKAWSTMTPINFSSQSSIFFPHQNYQIAAGGVQNTGFAVRPAVALKSCVTYTGVGDGKQSTPYEISDANC